jgi:diguanylate cyclase (GGDEF)-like protein
MPRSSAVRTAILTGGLGIVALAISAGWVSVQGWHTLTVEPVTASVLAVAFFLAEQNLITFEFRRQSHSMTFAGVPLVLGVLLLPVPSLVLARVAGSLIAMAMQRTSAEKLAYNISAFAFEAALTSTLCKFAVTGLDPVSMLMLIGCVAAVDQLMTALVLLVIRMHGIAMRRRDVGQVVIQSLVLSAVATAFGVALRILIMRGVTGCSLAVVLIALAVLGYRMYAATVQRHHTVTTVHDFVTSSATTASMADLASASLTRIRNMLRASAAELAVLDGGDDDTRSWTVYCADEDDLLTVRTGAPMASDWVRMRALHNGIATLAIRGRDAGVDAWLAGAGPGSSRLDDAIVVPVHSGTTRFGTLTVSGRLTDVVVFTDDDVQVLQTLGGHLAASMQNARLLETLSYDATHDALTGLANRSQLINDLAALDDEPAALMVVDLDHFKDVNDVLGHEVADELLAVVAERLRRVVPTAHAVARVGGDEFAVLLRGSESECDLIARAQSLATEISEPLQLHGATISVSVSTGVAATPAVRAPELMRCADTAMYAAKAKTHRLAIYSPAMDLGRAERIALAGDLRLALEHAPEQFVIYLQPKVDLRSGRTHGAEALARWNHPIHGLITPGRFVPIAEATGLIAPLTRRVLHQALVECASWNAAGNRIDVAVNLSARLLADLDVVEMVQAALASTSVLPGQLVLEITESVLMNDAEAAIATLQRVVDLGVRISLDDFGTGYSSLSYLQRLPACELKIDRSFVAAVDTDSSRSLALLRNVTTLGLDLGMQLVAEGIETGAQVDALNALGCMLGQGFYYARPMPASQFRSWLQHNQETALRLLPSA